MKKWTLNSWTKFPAKHLPSYVDKKELDLEDGEMKAQCFFSLIEEVIRSNI